MNIKLSECHGAPRVGITSCSECHQPAKFLFTCELGVEPHEYQTEDNGDEVNLCCKNCGHIQTKSNE